jgi:hypothetical protein
MLQIKLVGASSQNPNRSPSPSVSPGATSTDQVSVSTKAHGRLNIPPPPNKPLPPDPRKQVISNIQNTLIYCIVCTFIVISIVIYRLNVAPS